ncbi:MAG: hypothetical protein JW931_02475 [Methanomicrobiaceae archaeon]|nr:hypothetical protein [Methanomicrobiaceae archaeon]
MIIVDIAPNNTARRNSAIAFKNCPVYNCPRPGIKKDNINARIGDAIY